MSTDEILKRRALRLKADLTEGDRPKPTFLSTIYPAMDYGENMPPVVKTPSSIPGSNDSEAVEADDDKPEKGEKEQDEPGPSKTTSSSLRVVPGESAMVPEAHKRAAFELGYFGEGRSDQFIKNCVSIITGVKKLEQDDPTEGGDIDINPDAKDESCACGGTCDKCKAEKETRGPEHSKLSQITKKFSEPKTSYG
jgi:hypothetical protein